jgi:hypothetical protein
MTRRGNAMKRSKLTLALEELAAQESASLEGRRPRKKGRARRVPGQMNGYETKYSLILDERKRKGEVYDWRFEPFGLRLAPSTFYHPDFIVQMEDGGLEIHEVKGGFVKEDAWVKLKVAASMFPYFTFIKCQYYRKEWSYKEIPA